MKTARVYLSHSPAGSGTCTARHTAPAGCKGYGSHLLTWPDGAVAASVCGDDPAHALAGAIELVRHSLRRNVRAFRVELVRAISDAQRAKRASEDAFLLADDLALFRNGRGDPLEPIDVENRLREIATRATLPFEMLAVSDEMPGPAAVAAHV